MREREREREREGGRGGERGRERGERGGEVLTLASLVARDFLMWISTA